MKVERDSLKSFEFFGLGIRDYTVEGRLSFIVDNQVLNISSGDVCIIHQGTRFSYENQTGEAAKLLVVHTPSFELPEEIFEE